MRPVVVIDLELELIPAGEKLAVAGGEFVNDRGCTGPECVDIDPGTGQSFVGDEPKQCGVNLQACSTNSFGHVANPVVISV